MTPLRAIATEIAAARGYTLAELLAWDRRDPVARARHDAMLAQHRAGHTYAAIARFWGRDHSTVSHACKMAAQREKEGRMTQPRMSVSAEGAEIHVTLIGKDQHGTLLRLNRNNAVLLAAMLTEALQETAHNPEGQPIQ